MPRVRIIKESQESEVINPNGIHAGYSQEGELHYPITVGASACVGSLMTSTVTEIISETKFKTRNSTYVMEFLDEESK